MNTPPRALRRFAPFAFSTLALATSSGLLAAENASLAPMDISAPATEADQGYQLKFKAAEWWNALRQELEG